MSDVNLLRVRASVFWNVPLSHVFVEYSDPACHKTDCWNVCVGRNDGPGTDTIEAIWTYYHKDYDTGVRALLKRTKLDTPTWQEDLEKLNSGVTLWFDKSVSWYQEEDPQTAWDTCDDAEILMQVLAVTAPVHLVPICWDICKRVARPCAPQDIRDLFYELYNVFRAHEQRSKEQKKLARILDSHHPDDPSLEDSIKNEADLHAWRYARMLSSLDAVMAGMPEKAFHVAYYAQKMGLTGLADVVRNHIVIEQFTR